MAKPSDARLCCLKVADVIAVTVVKGTSVVHSVIPAKAGIQSTIIEVVIVYKESPVGIVICWIPASETV